MFKLGLSGCLVMALLMTVVPAGVAAESQPVDDMEDVEAMVAELASTEYFSPELYLRYKEYKDQSVDILTYTVTKGDNLYSIAEAFGVSISTISANNKISNPHLIHPGQELVFPQVSGLLYTVKEGDELEEIAKKYKVDAETIWFANALESQALEADTQLVLPGAKLPTPPKPPMVASRSGSVSLANISMPGFIWPLVGRISSGFGMRGSRFHAGIDITGKTGKPIVAAASGRVVSCGWRGSYGYMVQVEHNSGVATLYAHASKILVRKGDWVEKGQTIAHVGSTGYSTGPHLHFEVRVNGKQVNPRVLLP